MSKRQEQWDPPAHGVLDYLLHLAFIGTVLIMMAKVVFLLRR